jgi:molecular chaperone Hsp33
VPLDGESLEEIAGVYFRQSEQLPTRVRLGVAEFFDRDEAKARRATAGGPAAWSRSSCPRRRSACAFATCHGGDGDEGRFHKMADDDDNWAEAVTRWSNTVDADELTDPQVPAPSGCCYRLFHERGVRVYEPQRRLSTAAPARARS